MFQSVCICISRCVGLWFVNRCHWSVCFSKIAEKTKSAPGSFILKTVKRTSRICSKKKIVLDPKPPLPLTFIKSAAVLFVLSCWQMELSYNLLGGKYTAALNKMESNCWPKMLPHPRSRGCWLRVCSTYSWRCKMLIVQVLEQVVTDVNGSLSSTASYRYRRGLHLQTPDPSRCRVASPLLDVLKPRLRLNMYRNTTARGKFQRLPQVFNRGTHSFGFSNYPLMHIQWKANCKVILVSRLFLGLSPSSEKGKIRRWSREASRENTAVFTQECVFVCVCSCTRAICLLKRHSMEPLYQLQWCRLMS